MNAIALKPNKNSQESALSLALNINDGKNGIALALQKNVLEKKEIISRRLELALFTEAFNFNQTEYIPLTDNIKNDSTLMDLMIAKKSENPTDAENVSLQAIQNSRFSAKTTEELWSFAFARRSDKLLTALLAKSALPLDSELLKIMNSAEIKWNLFVLQKLNDTGHKLSLNLGQFQAKYLDVIYAQPESSLLNLAQIKSDLALLSRNSGTKIAL